MALDIVLTLGMDGSRGKVRYMNRNLIKYIIIAMLYVIIIIELIVFFQTFGNYKKAGEYANKLKSIDNTQTEEQIETGKLEKVRERNQYYTAVFCVNQYLEYIYKQDSQAVYNCLDKSYIEEKQITQENLLNKVGNSDSKYLFTAKKMYQQELPDETIQYYAHGKLSDVYAMDSSTEEKEFYISIKINRKYGTFTILPDTYINEL